MAFQKIRNGVAKHLILFAKQIKTHDHVFHDEVLYRLDPVVDEFLQKSDLEVFMNAFVNIASVFDCVNTIAENAAEVPLRVWRNTGDGREECKDHPILDLLQNPNDHQTMFHLLESIFAYTTLTGNCFAFLEFAQDPIGVELLGNEPIMVHIPRPDSVEVRFVHPEDNGKRQRIFKQKKGSTHFTSEEVIHFRTFNPFSVRMGVPPIAAGRNALLIELFLDVFGRSFFQNAVVPGQIFTTEGEISDVAFERFKAVMDREHRGIGQHHKMLLLSGNIRAVDNRPPGPKDVGAPEMQELTQKRIYFNLGCYHLAAHLQGMSGDGLKEAYKLFWQDAMSPKLTRIEQTFNKYLMPRFSSFEGNENCFLEFDVRSVPGMRDDFGEEATALFKLVQSGLWSHQEGREFQGKPREMRQGDTTGLGFMPATSRFQPNDTRRITEEQTMQRAIEEATNEDGDTDVDKFVDVLMDLRSKQYYKTQKQLRS